MVNEIRRKAMMGVEDNPYPELLLNKAWDTTTGEAQTAPTDKEGYAVTPFFALDFSSTGRISVEVKAGFSNAGGYIASIGFKTIPNQSKLQGAWGQNTDPKTVNASSANRYVSATLKMSELDNCYIYDNNAQAYLWKGRNVGGVILDYQLLSGYSAERSAA